MAERADEERSILVQVRVVDPVPGCAYAIQRRGGGIDQVQLAAREALTFTTSITLKLARDGTLDPAGLHVNGPRRGRFLYINSGTMAGQTPSCWTRRAKVSLEPIVAAVRLSLDVMPPLIETTIPGRAKDGGPVCASVTPLAPWKHAP
jgi:hypothetical protein